MGVVCGVEPPSHYGFICFFCFSGVRGSRLTFSGCGASRFEVLRAHTSAV